ncbi:hypothetical protein J3R30DRAFT_3462238 [Lentinula aciculospora]|uniref:Uncharacterized protein n=1 Tax=Lentinula aciculospora TaxID=153920 RepID=A0A9W9DQQ4_9AGAR|nr:hypothetical protein J3R30DRAFT_3462238 [Lentinula aciculospora]
MAFNTVFAGFGIGISDLILIIRTYAMYKNSRKVLVILILAWVIVGIVNLVYTTRRTQSFSDATSLTPVMPLKISPCFVERENRTGSVAYISLLIGETGGLSIQFVRGCQSGSNHNWARLVVVVLTLLQGLEDRNKWKMPNNTIQLVSSEVLFNSALCSQTSKFSKLHSVSCIQC